MRSFIEAHYADLKSVVIFLAVLAGIVAAALLVFETMASIDQRQAEQFINECQQVIEVSAAKCQLLWDWRQR